MKVSYPADFRDMLIEIELRIKDDPKKFYRRGRYYWCGRNAEINARDGAKLRTGSHPHNFRLSRIQQKPLEQKPS